MLLSYLKTVYQNRSGFDLLQTKLDKLTKALFVSYCVFSFFVVLGFWSTLKGVCRLFKGGNVSLYND